MTVLYRTYSLFSINRTLGELLEGAFPAKLIKTCCLEDDKWKHALQCLARVIQLGVVRQLGSNSETLREEGDRTEGEAGTGGGCPNDDAVREVA